MICQNYAAITTVQEISACLNSSLYLLPSSSELSSSHQRHPRSTPKLSGCVRATLEPNSRELVSLRFTNYQSLDSRHSHYSRGLRFPAAVFDCSESVLCLRSAHAACPAREHLHILTHHMVGLVFMFTVGSGNQRVLRYGVLLVNCHCTAPHPSLDMQVSIWI